MKFVTIPADIAIAPHPEAPDGTASQPMSFARFARIAWFDDHRGIAKGFSSMIRWASLAKRISEAKPGDVIAIEDEDFATLKPIVEHIRPELGASLSVHLLIQAAPFSTAVLEAPDKA